MGPATPELDPALADLGSPRLYLNRELSLLEFDRRVLQQALDPEVPLLERLRFLTIFSSNLDEFFEVRVAGLKQRLALDLAAGRAHDGGIPETLARISDVAHALVEQQYRVLNESVLPALEKQGIHLLKRSQWNERQQAWISQYFEEQALPVLSPVGLDPSHPFPNVQNKSLNFIVSLEGEDAFGRVGDTAVVPVPRCLPRVLALPDERGRPTTELVMISSIIHAHVDRLFPGMRVLRCHQFRITRNSDLWVDEEEVDDLLNALKGELPRRNFGAAVRLEAPDDIADDLVELLLERFGLEPPDLYRVNGPVNLPRLSGLLDLVQRPDLKYPPLHPGLPANLEPEADIFEALQHGDLLLHHPFQSFRPVIDFIQQASEDPEVLAIKQTLYRTGPDSPLVDALIEAARQGKAVTAVVELRARFDEAANIKMATRLQEAGASVAYGIANYKCHAKMALVVRREAGQLRRYVHLGTGNYHTGTTRAYTDISLLTADPEIGADVHDLFLLLTGLGWARPSRKILTSPFALHAALVAAIDAEAEAARAGLPSGVVARMNALTEPTVIRALYRASQAGVPIDLIVRGMCCLRPGVSGVSENIRVRSIIGRFLEHARVWCFHAGGQRRLWCSSADWRGRNLIRRVEVCFPVDDPRAKERVWRETLQTYLEDNTQSWSLGADGRWTRSSAADEPAHAAQTALLRELSGGALSER